MKIIISVALALFLVACSEDNTASSPNQDIFKEATKTVKPVVNAAQESVVEVVLEATPETTVIVAEETTEVEVVAKEVKTVVATKSGADLYKACSSCHGANGEKKALNKSQVIQAWSESQVSTALNGYKDGSYGGAMKGLMKSQVSKLSDEDIAALSKYISEL